MKKTLMVIAMAFVAIGMFSVLFAQDAAGASAVASKTNEEIATYLTNLDADGWCALLNALDEKGNETLQMRVLVIAQQVINSFPADKASDYAENIMANVNSVEVGKSIAGKYTLFLRADFGTAPERLKLDSMFHSDTLSKGGASRR